MNLAKLDKRQKFLLGAFVIVLLILIWQVYGLFGDHISKASPTTAKFTRLSAPIPGQLAAVKAGMPLPSTASMPGTSTTIDPATNTQAEYLRLVNEYQMAQLQRMIAEDNEAIAVAKRNAAQAISDTTKLAGADSMSADNSDQGLSDTYALVYTGQQSDGQWTATLKKNGQSYDVVPGRQLPDGSQVTSIDENGVLMTQNQGATKFLVTFSGITQVGVGKQSNNTMTQNATVQTTIKVAKPLAPVKAVQEVANKISVVAPITNKKPVMANSNVALQTPIQPVQTVNIAVPKTTQSVTTVSTSKNVIALNSSQIAKLDALFDATPKANKTVITSTTPTNVATTTVAATAVIKPSSPTLTATQKSSMIALGEKAILSPTENHLNKNTVTLTATQAQALKPIAQVAAQPIAATIPASTASTPAMMSSQNQYTIQLTADRELTDAQAFIKMHQLQDKTSFIHGTTENGNDRYVAIYGQYATRAEAVKALQQLPAAVRSEGAYVVANAKLQDLYALAQTNTTLEVTTK